VAEVIYRINLKISIIILLFIFIAPFTSLNAGSFGTSTAEFLKIKPEAVQAGMGEAGTALPDGTNALIFNPANLALLDKAELTPTGIFWFNNINMQHIAFGVPFEKGSGFGVSLLYIDYGSYDSTGGTSPSVSLKNAVLTAGFGKSFGNTFSFGVQSRGLYEDFMGDVSMGVSFDTGISLSLLENNIYAALTVKNLGFLSGTNDMFPVEFGAGLGFRVYEGSFDVFSAAIDFSKAAGADNIFAGAGIEYFLFRAVALRLGAKYSNAMDLGKMSFSDVTKLTSLTGGLGIHVGDFGLDYAFTPMGDLGAVHRISATIKFGASMYEQQLAEKNAEFVPKAIEVPKVNVENGRIKSVSFKPNVPEEKVKEWSLDIKTSDGKIVKSFSGMGEVPKDLSWDGTDNVGKIAGANTNYIFDFKAKDYTGQIIKTVGQIIQPKKYEFEVPVDKPFVPLKNREMLVAPITLLVSSDSDERKTVPFVMVNREIKKIKDWNFQIFDSKDMLLKEFSGGETLPSYLVWDGLDSAGKYVDDLKGCRYVLNVNGVNGKKAVIKDRQVIRDPFIITAKSKKLKLGKKIYFDQNSSVIMPEMADRLNQLAAEIEGQKNVQVYIQGHSSEEGDSAQNLYLSQERAKTVLRYFVEKYKMSPLSITTVGYGAKVPLNKNRTDTERRINRRVEIIIMGEK
jgi:outer membrane protein OmpA-like peptidoglycan-associated protein